MPQNKRERLLNDFRSGKEKIVVATDANYAPQSYLNDQGELEGFDISVAIEAGKRMGVKVRHVTPDWDLITAGKWGKRWDVSVGSMTPTKERKKALWFSMTYYSSPAQFAIHKNNTSIKTVNDLAGKVIGMATESTYDRYLHRDLEMENVTVTYQNWNAKELRTYPTDANAIEDLVLGDGARLDALLTSLTVVLDAIRGGCGSGCPIKLIGKSPFYEVLSFALDKSRPNSESLLKKLNEAIQSMYDDGTLVNLSMKYFKADLIPKL